MSFRLKRLGHSEAAASWQSGIALRGTDQGRQEQ